MTLIRLAGLLPLLVLSIAVSACGDDDDDSGADGGGDATATTEATGDATGGNSETVEITIADFAYDPAAFTVAAGEEVTFSVTNDDTASHTFTTYRDAEFNRIGDVSIQVGPGESSEGTATLEAGQHFYRCELHPSQMTGSFTAE